MRMYSGSPELKPVKMQISMRRLNSASTSGLPVCVIAALYPATAQDQPERRYPRRKR